MHAQCIHDMKCIGWYSAFCNLWWSKAINRRPSDSYLLYNAECTWWLSAGKRKNDNIWAQTFCSGRSVFFFAGDALIEQKRGWMFSMRLQIAQLPGQPVHFWVLYTKISNFSRDLRLSALDSVMLCFSIYLICGFSLFLLLVHLARASFVRDIWDDTWNRNFLV